MFWSMRDHVYKVTLQDYNGSEKLNTDFTATQAAVCNVYSYIYDAYYTTITATLALFVCLKSVSLFSLGCLKFTTWPS